MDIKKVKDDVNEWANDWGRRVGIYGVKTDGFEPGHHDDLDAFRHAFCHCVLVSFVTYDDLDQVLSEIVGALIEVLGSGDSTSECPREMDYHNNDVGKNLALNNWEMGIIIAKGGDPIHEIAKRVAEAVRAEKTINRLDDPRMPKHCALQAKLPGGWYIWKTEGDEKVRWEHAMRNGKQFALEKTPEGGHPGTDYNCRCKAVPLIKRNPIE